MLSEDSSKLENIYSAVPLYVPWP